MRLTVLFFMAVLLLSSAAFGGAREHFVNGRDYYDEGRYHAAIEEFQKAYDLDPKPELLYNMAQAFEKLGKLQESVDHLNRFLKENRKKRDVSAIKNKISNLEDCIRKTGISVTATEPEATIYVDDQEKGVTPIESVIPLTEGMHAVRITKPGFEPFVMNVGVSAGYSVPVYAELTPAEPEPVVAPAPTSAPQEPEEAITEAQTTEEPPVESEPTPEPEPVAAPAEEPALPPQPAPAAERHPLDIVPWAIAGTGAAMAIGGFAGIGTVALVQDDKSLAHAADGLGWPGVALAVGGTVWGVLRLRQKKQEGLTAAAAPFFHTHGGGMAAVVIF